MRPSLVSSSALLLTAFATTVSALEALTNSPCATQCGNSLGGTNAADIVCYDSDYNTTQAGQTFNTCISCQLSSKYVDPTSNQTDVQWGLYNLRWALSYCLFGYPNNTAAGSSPCTTRFGCGPIQNAIEEISVSSNETGYAYCEGPNQFLGNTLGIAPSYQKCQACLAGGEEQFYLSNFVVALTAGCEQHQTPNQTISVKGSLFSTNAVTITTSSAASSGASQSSGGLSLGAKVGIAIGVIVAFLVSLGFCIVCNGKRRRKAYLRRVQQESGYDEWKKHSHFSPDSMGGAAFGTGPSPAMSSGPYFDSPADSVRPLQPWAARLGQDDSPATGPGEKAYFSPYVSQYTSPVSANDQKTAMGRLWSLERNHSVHSQVPMGGEWPADRKDSSASALSGSRSKKGKEKSEVDYEYEMQNVALAVSHPGSEQTDSLGAVTSSEADARRS